MIGSIVGGQQVFREILLWVCGVVFVAVFSVMFLSVFRHRRSRDGAEPGFHESTAVELAWTVVPLVIITGLVAMAASQVISRHKAADAGAPAPQTQTEARLPEPAAPAQPWTPQALQARGEQVYASTCTPCHQPTGRGISGTFPALDGSPVVLGPARDQIRLVLNGRPNTAMASFKTQLNDAEIAAVITYTRNAWSNRAGEAVIQPGDVAAARTGH